LSLINITLFHLDHTRNIAAETRIVKCNPITNQRIGNHQKKKRGSEQEAGRDNEEDFRVAGGGGGGTNNNNNKKARGQAAEASKQATYLPGEGGAVDVQ
jgi:hypothetical protein